MPFSQLVEHFNDRLGFNSYNSHARPFAFRHGAVQGLYGPIQIGSQLTPVRSLEGQPRIAGFYARSVLTNSPCERLYRPDIEHLLDHPMTPSIDTLSILNFDRLSRTVHMLNYLLQPEQAEADLLFLDVDPRHILGVKENHGVYFEEIIVRCGLETRNVALSVPVSPAYARFQSQLNRGLENYRSRGYRIALKFDDSALSRQAEHLLQAVAPNYVILSARRPDKSPAVRQYKKLQRWNGLIRALGGQSLLTQADAMGEDALQSLGFDLFETDGNAAVPWGQPPQEEAGHGSNLAGFS